jgi:hypothetical protein
VEQLSKLPFDDFPIRTVVLCVRGIEDKYCTIQIDAARQRNLPRRLSRIMEVENENS